ncbi:N4 gp52-like protein [Sulfitobacter phage EE36phi1]|uniref:N4 gp52-like protein n=1 Tax=Sulfitobacter phage EE36phi1 TaxID=490913 RepID=C4NTE2_9CAUD|nr:N4 gp52-like protein [Sulfitobacter phage EE36phi1]ACL81408.1 N4 gp52-like protein [Sulfitobacter phage EE36phi1]
MTALSWGNTLGDATVNGSQMSAMGSGALDYSIGTPTGGTGTGVSSVTVQSPTVPGTTGVGAQQGSGPGFWSKDGGAGLVLGGVQVLGNLWYIYQAHKMAKEQMSFAREQWDTNLANQTQTYNTALEDRIRSRHFTEGKGSGETDAYLSEHSL